MPHQINRRRSNNAAKKLADAVGNYVRFTPADCPHCEYDRRFAGFEAGGWIQQDNNGPIVACPVCNPDGHWPTDPGAAHAARNDLPSD